MLKQLTILLLGLMVGSTGFSATPKYYPEFHSKTSEDLKKELYTILSQFHKPQGDKPDEILANCSEPSCFKHTEVSYKKARAYLFGFLHLEGSSFSSYRLDTYYCEASLTNNDFPKEEALGPMMIPKHTVVNAEHAWPQSKFTGKFSKATQKSDLHILFPVDSKVNSIRQNLPYGEVVEPTKDVCPEALSGKDDAGTHVFEPSLEDKGDMARATFYFSIRYQAKIDTKQEAILRKWAKQDPVDAREVIRNEKIFSIQMDRNPFIDFPELEDLITDF